MLLAGSLANYIRRGKATSVGGLFHVGQTVKRKKRRREGNATRESQIDQGRM
jgi:hypothetical protein